MAWTPVSSSMISAFDYDAQTKVLQVRFTNGSTYKYDDVLAEDADGMRTARSAGVYFNTVIKDVYPGYQI